MRRISRRVVLFLSLVSTVGAAQFPGFEAETLTGRKVTVPTPGASSPVLLIIGFTHASNEQTGYWAKKIPKDLVSVYSVATLGGAPKLMRRMIVRSMKGGVPAGQQDNFLVTYAKDDPLKQAVGFKEPNDAYLALLGPDGSIVWTFHGAFTHTALKELSDRVHGMRQ
ncbi:MAG: hypothetical protein KGN84_12235 [Acidobacteriota bacterium]|nr:hypothetical protein [Acidobacteriota bacterium]